MDTLHTVLRTIRGESKSRPDHITVFREFLNQLERINRKSSKTARPPKRSKTKSSRVTHR